MSNALDKSIDFEHLHYGIRPHIHFNLDHFDNGIPLKQSDIDNITFETIIMNKNDTIIYGKD